MSDAVPCRNLNDYESSFLLMHFHIQTSTTTIMSDQAGPSTTTKPKVQRTTKETHPNLPPGLVLDADGKVCKVCNSWQDYGKSVFKKKSGSGKAAAGFGAMAGMTPSASSSSSSSTSTSASTSPTSISSTATPRSREDCPADTAALGRSTWTFLHTTAAYYPLSPSTHQQTQMHNLLSSLSLLYPCIPCAEDFQEKVKENPPDVSGRLGLSRWLCERHNEVNLKLGKEGFGCDWDNLDKRWKGGPEDGSCD
jgi:FAD-linked sulfhydryl oxidase